MTHFYSVNSKQNAVLSGAGVRKNASNEAQTCFKKQTYSWVLWTAKLLRFASFCAVTKSPAEGLDTADALPLTACRLPK